MCKDKVKTVLRAAGRALLDDRTASPSGFGYFSARVVFEAQLNLDLSPPTYASQGAGMAGGIHPAID
jgi:hypothetical protein